MVFLIRQWLTNRQVVFAGIASTAKTTNKVGAGSFESADITYGREKSIQEILQISSFQNDAARLRCQILPGQRLREAMKTVPEYGEAPQKSNRP